MGWEARHLFEFDFNGTVYAHPEHADEMDIKSTEDVIFSEALGSLKEFSYVYDFGDYWKHKVEISNVLEHDPRLKYPVCIAGENACPPEDCGGPGGFEELKKVLTGKKSDEKDEMLEWVGGFFSPNTFDPNFVNKHLLWNDHDPELDFLEH